MSNLPANITNLKTGLAKAKQRHQIGPDGGQFLKLSKSGVWNYGADELEVEKTALVAVNPGSFAEGYICWSAEGSSGPLGEEMVSLYDEPLQRGELPDLGAPWSEQVAFQAVIINGVDKGVELIYKASSKGGRKAFATLINEILAQYEANPDDPAVVPIIELNVDSYRHKSYGKIFTPDFKIVKWATMEDTIDSIDLMEGPEAEPEPEPEPAPRRRRRAR